MPQIWMTYGELAGLLGCGLDEVPERIRRDSLDRRKSRDGQTRVKLSLHLAGLFIEKLKSEPQQPALEEAIDTMRRLYAEMASYEGLPQQRDLFRDRHAGDDSGEPVALAGGARR
jgi:hypothetical protein